MGVGLDLPGTDDSPSPRKISFPSLQSSVRDDRPPRPWKARASGITRVLERRMSPPRLIWAVRRQNRRREAHSTPASTGEHSTPYPFPSVLFSPSVGRPLPVRDLVAPGSPVSSARFRWDAFLARGRGQPVVRLATMPNTPTHTPFQGLSPNRQQNGLQPVREGRRAATYLPDGPPAAPVSSRRRRTRFGPRGMFESSCNNVVDVGVRWREEGCEDVGDQRGLVSPGQSGGERKIFGQDGSTQAQT